MIEYFDYIHFPWWFWVSVAIGINWGVPFLLSYTYALLFWALDYYCFWGFYKGIPVFEVIENGSWHTKAWKGWAGLGLFWTIYLRGQKSPETMLMHETRHVWQVLVLGLLQVFLYWAIALFILIALPNRHPYLDNPFERDARRYAGQTVDIPKSVWIQNGDRWPWW